MLVSENKSRPVYKGLTLDPAARRHIVAVEGEGALAAIEMLSGHPEAAARTTIVYTPGASAGRDREAALEALRPEALHVLPSVPTALVRINGLLATATMGTRLYAAGVEGFVGQTVAAGMEHGIDPFSIPIEHRGSLARRVQCVHCKGFTENVTVSPVTCAHCGLSLLVRDHYSRRLGAFQGVCINAEEPGVVPPAEELFA